MLVMTLVLFLVDSNASAAMQLGQERELKRDVNLYFRHFSHGRYDLMWGLSSAKFKEGNENNVTDYLQNLRKAGLVTKIVKIEQVAITGNVAVVRLVVSIKSRKENRWVDVGLTNAWVWEKRRWRYDHQIEER